MRKKPETQVYVAKVTVMLTVRGFNLENAKGVAEQTIRGLENLASFRVEEIGEYCK